MDIASYGELNVLTALAWGEARGEPYDGKFAVCCVVLNRVRDGRWPDEIIEAALQPWQFSCFSLKDPNYPEALKAIKPYGNGLYRDMAWRECRSAAQLVIGNWRRDITNGANHYHSRFIRVPYWAEGHPKVYEVGNHVFYRL